MDPNVLILFHLLKKSKITYIKTHFIIKHFYVKTKGVLLTQESGSTDEERKAQ